MMRIGGREEVEERGNEEKEGREEEKRREEMRERKRSMMTRYHGIQLALLWGAYFHQVIDSCKKLRISGQSAVHLVSWPRNKPLSKFSLKHQHSTPAMEKKTTRLEVCPPTTLKTAGGGGRIKMGIIPRMSNPRSNTVDSG